MISIDKIDYRPAHFIRQNVKAKSIEPIGIDTEADTSGRCFMICTSLGDTFIPSDYPAFLFTRKYIRQKFVTYNLKYDSGAMLQHLPIENLKELQKTNTTSYRGYFYRVIAYKLLSIQRGKNSVHIYDMLNFYESSLEAAAVKYLGKHKVDIGTRSFTPQYIRDNWKQISEYCIQDAVLVAELAEILIKQFESFGVYPQKLYSVAYISLKYFQNNSPYINVKRYWYGCRELLDYAMQSFNGGKFEVTRKGTGYFWEYDMISAYPYEIANLVDITEAKVKHTSKYIKSATYGFLKCNINIPHGVYSPVAMKQGEMNYFPIGTFEKVITKNEYDYLISKGCTVTILDAWWLCVKNKTYPYRSTVNTLVKYKDKFKAEHKDSEYHTIKIFLNSFYGKMVQLIERDGRYKAGTSWNPIYSSVITANCRIRVSELQQCHRSVVAVHTDSIISTAPLPYPKNGVLGSLIYDCEGHGVILGSGVYQIGKKSKIRGFDTKRPLFDIIPKKGKTLTIPKIRPYTWREVAHRSLSMNMVNRFVEHSRKLKINSDTKRIWIDDYKDFSEVRKRVVESYPWDYYIQQTR